MQFHQLGPYRIGNRLGRGGMGTVYEGHDDAAGQVAAVKVLSPMLAGDPGFRERFEVEIETLKKLRHPNIVRLFGWGEEDGHLFYSMELVHGTNLEQELRNGRRFTWREVTDIALRLCKALKHAHDRGVIHRDIKPANLMLQSDGDLKLSDFGIAKLFGSVGMTVDGGVLGTAEYMSPEQADGRPVTSRCDLYSVGGVLYSLLAGRPPFRAKTLPEMLQLQRFAAPDPVRRYAPDTPEELEQIVLQLLEKDPEKRIPNALVLGRRLAAMARGLSLPEGGSQPPPLPGETDFEIGPPPGNGAAPPPTPEIAGPTDRTRMAGFDVAGPNDDTRVPPGQPVIDPTAEADTQVATHPDLPPGDFDIAEAPTGVAPGPPISEAPTAAGPGPQPSYRLEPAGSRGAAPPDDATSAHPSGRRSRTPDTVRGASATSAGETAAGGKPVRPKSTFTVAQEVETEPVDDPTPPHVFWAQVGLIMLGLALLAALGWYLSRPPSANSLYRVIAAAAESEDTQELALMDDKVEEFLSRYPSDPRRAEVEDWWTEIREYRQQTSARHLARQLSRKPALNAIERAYLEALDNVQLEPHRAAMRLQAFVTLYGSRADSSRMAKRCVEAAQKQLEQLQTELAHADEDLRQTLAAELARAERLNGTDPAVARAVWQAIVDLYDNDPAAEAAVKSARQALGQ